MTPLRRRLIEDLKLRNLSPHAQDAYVQAVVKLVLAHDLPGQAEVRAYLM